MLAQGAWLIASPASDQPLLALLERAVAPSECGPTQLDAYVDQLFAEMMDAHPAAAATVPGNFVRNTLLPFHGGALRYYGNRATPGMLTGD